MSDKPITWSQGIAVVGGAFGLCCMGFMLLHQMVVADRAEAAGNLARAVEARTNQMNRISDAIDAYQHQNNIDHKEIMVLLTRMQK